MRILHLLKSEPDGETRQLIDALSADREASEVSLHAAAVDYDELVGTVFASDHVVCWW